MTGKAQKTTPNLALKLAIVGTGKKQGAIARSARIEQVQLSKIVTGRIEPSPTERKALARVLARPESDLFPSSAEASL